MENVCNNEIKQKSIETISLFTFFNTEICLKCDVFEIPRTDMKYIFCIEYLSS